MVDYKNLFSVFNNKLSDRDIHLEIICVGGFVLQYHNMRTTQDIDAFYKSNAQIEQAIRETHQECSADLIDELWLNNSVANMNIRPHEKICDTVYSFSNLIVKTPPLKYIIGMKLESQRELDIRDVGEIIKHLNIDSPFLLKEDLADYGFSTDFSLLLESFSEAYGIKWLEEFYVKYEQELIEGKVFQTTPHTYKPCQEKHPIKSKE